MIYQNMECPTCGNEITVKGTEDAQKCIWCRRFYKVKVERRKNGRYRWSINAIDFQDVPKTSRKYNFNKNKDTRYN